VGEEKTRRGEEKDAGVFILLRFNEMKLRTGAWRRKLSKVESWMGGEICVAGVNR
jgi:hypothetical protein